ncbi:hypothetical protein [Acidomonas methanolica]|uniref:hypothetical protein n=1 Tax=Acidomonas methanolica TaxID=437 RepID=UPI001052AF11|nr:hypothetical protein [Acidomonas methanolica]MBU2654428.1 hypothetical protein [Acidomonas methanolica]GBQ60811.1 hypothetical protein AA0498_2875 [Acidomonas methanolica]
MAACSSHSATTLGSFRESRNKLFPQQSPLEWEDTRWTSGDALLPLGTRQPDSVAILTIQIKAGGPYLVVENALEDVALAMA